MSKSKGIVHFTFSSGPIAVNPPITPPPANQPPTVPGPTTIKTL